MSTFKRVDVPELGFWERADIPFLKLSIIARGLYTALTGVFRGKAYPKSLRNHIIVALIQNSPWSPRQQQYIDLSTPEVYESSMRARGLEPEAVSLPHNADGYWIGNKNAKKVLIYYHGGGFAMAARPSHIHFFADLVKILNNNGNDIAVFFLRYTLTPHEKYPTQLRQAVECLRYILEGTSRSPSDVILGGDSAGGNLALATLLHISHPHPDIKPLVLDTPLAGTFAFAPWVNFSTDWPSFTQNAYRDICGAEKLKLWAGMYLGEGESDYWSEPSKAPVEWWADAKTERILVLVGSDEVLFSSIEAFTKKVKAVFPDTTFIVGADETHDAHIYVEAGVNTKTSRELRQWVSARL